MRGNLIRGEPADDAVEALCTPLREVSHIDDPPAESSAEPPPAPPELPPDVLSQIACHLALVNHRDADHVRYRGRGSREVLAMRSMCRAWRAAIEETDLVWYRVIQRAFPGLSVGYIRRLHPVKRLQPV